MKPEALRAPLLQALQLSKSYPQPRRHLWQPAPAVPVFHLPSHRPRPADSVGPASFHAIGLFAPRMREIQV